MELRDHIALITGGAKGIGKVTADLFLKQGATVIIWDVDDINGEQEVHNWKEQGFTSFFYRVNTANAEEVEKATAEVLTKVKKIDILINNAGITRDATLKNMTPTQWQQVIDVNLSGVFHCTKSIAPHMVARQYGRIINAASVVAHNGSFGQSNYVAAKAGVIGLTKVWARELGSKGITVNAIAPGFIETDMTAVLGVDFMEDLLKRTPVRRIGQPIDIANAYLFLASEKSSFITGACLHVDGGLTL
jgi:3-oxoacyl-[acyl-carrier protein] reductase